MKLEKRFKMFPHRRDGSPAPAPDAELPTNEIASMPAIIASVFGKPNVKRRARLLGRLLCSALALAVVGGGVFAKYQLDARWPEVPISFEDAAHATSSQVHDLVGNVEQSNPINPSRDVTLVGRNRASKSETEPRNLLRRGSPAQTPQL